MKAWQLILIIVSAVMYLAGLISLILLIGAFDTMDIKNILIAIFWPIAVPVLLFL